MPRKSVISYGSQVRDTGEYYLATTADRMQFYLFEEPREGQENSWTLINELDRTQLLAAGNKETAKTWAKMLGLNTWAYVRV